MQQKTNEIKTTTKKKTEKTRNNNDCCAPHPFRFVGLSASWWIGELVAVCCIITRFGGSADPQSNAILYDGVGPFVFDQEHDFKAYSQVWTRCCEKRISWKMSGLHLGRLPAQCFWTHWFSKKSSLGMCPERDCEDILLPPGLQCAKCGTLSCSWFRTPLLVNYILCKHELYAVTC